MNNKGTDQTVKMHTGWFVPLLFANPEDRFYHVEAIFSESVTFH